MASFSRRGSYPFRIALFLALSSIVVLACSAITIASPSIANGAVTDSSAYGIWSGSTRPIGGASTDNQSVVLGTRFTVSRDGWITGLRYYRFPDAQASPSATLWSSSGSRLAAADFSPSPSSGWLTTPLASPIRVLANQQYIVSYAAPKGRYAVDLGVFASGRTVANRNLVATAGVYSYTQEFPNKTWNGASYYADVIYTELVPSQPSSTLGPSSTPTTRLTSPGPSQSLPTTSPAPATQTGIGTNCAQKPSVCGFPDTTNTGVANYSVLRQVPGQVSSGPGWSYDSRGWISVTVAGTVLENIDTSAPIEVLASNVTIRNSRLTTSGEIWAIGLRHANNVRVEDVEILPSSPRLAVGIKDVYGDVTGTVILRTEVARTSTGIQMGSGTLQDSFVHDMGFQQGDHVNGTTSNGSINPLIIRHNTIFNQIGQTDAVSFFQDFGIEANRTLDKNLLAGGGYTIYGGGGGKGKSYNISITNNRISNLFFANGGSYGAVTAFDSDVASNSWSNNVWDSTGKAIPRP